MAMVGLSRAHCRNPIINCICSIIWSHFSFFREKLPPRPPGQRSEPEAQGVSINPFTKKRIQCNQSWTLSHIQQTILKIEHIFAKIWKRPLTNLYEQFLLLSQCFKSRLQMRKGKTLAVQFWKHNELFLLFPHCFQYYLMIILYVFKVLQNVPLKFSKQGIMKISHEVKGYDAIIAPAFTCRLGLTKWKVMKEKNWHWNILTAWLWKK